MTFPARILIGFCGVCLVFALWVGGQSIVNAGKDAPQGSRAAPSRRIGPFGTRKLRKSLEHRQVRRIVPGKASGPLVESNLERLPPRAATPPPVAAPPAPTAAAQAQAAPKAPPDPGKRKETVLYQPLADAAGVLDASGYHITLAGISPVLKDETCPEAAGGTWPCGMVARTNFRSWLRGRAMTCDVPGTKGAVVTSCKIGSDDPALWLVENGWARSDDPRYRDAAAKARKGKRGMFGDAPKAFSALPAIPAPEPLPAMGEDTSDQAH